MLIPESLLQNSPVRTDFSRPVADAENADGHFWHDALSETHIIAPAKSTLFKRNRSCGGAT